MPSRRRRVRQWRSLPSPGLLRRRLRRPGAASRLRAEALYRASVQAGRAVVVLTYSVYAPRTNGSAVLSVERRVLACTGWVGETVGFLNSPWVCTSIPLLLSSYRQGLKVFLYGCHCSALFVRG